MPVSKSKKNDNVSEQNHANTQPNKKEETKGKELDLKNFSDLLECLSTEKDIEKLKSLFSKHIKKIISSHQNIADKYHFLFLYDDNKGIDEDMTDKIYDAIPPDNEKPIFLLLHSRGGQVEPAYLISKTCKEKSPEFIVVIPRRAKSAATLISLGANSIHMGSMSELGPIDPQFGSLPALSLSSSLQSIAKVVSAQPLSSDMFAKFLSEKLDLRILGYFERVSESAEQYAQRLLVGKKPPKEIQEIAHSLVYEYKDHSFVIDKEEAKARLGDIIKTDTEEYRLANEIHKFMRELNILSSIIRKKNVGIIGGSNGVCFYDTKDK